MGKLVVGRLLFCAGIFFCLTGIGPIIGIPAHAGNELAAPLVQVAQAQGVHGATGKSGRLSPGENEARGANSAQEGRIADVWSVSERSGERTATADIFTIMGSEQKRTGRFTLFCKDRSYLQLRMKPDGNSRGRLRILDALDPFKQLYVEVLDREGMTLSASAAGKLLQFLDDTVRSFEAAGYGDEDVNLAVELAGGRTGYFSLRGYAEAHRQMQAGCGSEAVSTVAASMAAATGPAGQDGRQPKFDEWALSTEGGAQSGFSDIYAVSDPEDLDAMEQARRVGTLDMVCVGNDHIEYRVSPDIKDLTFGIQYPAPDAPKPVRIGNIRNGVIDADGSVDVANFFLQYIAAMTSRGGDDTHFNYVDLRVNGQVAYVTFKGFAAVRDQVRSSCFGARPAAATAASKGDPVRTRPAAKPTSGPVDTGSRGFRTLVAAMCGNGWTDLLRLQELGTVNDAFIADAMPQAEQACNTVYGAGHPNGMGGFLIMKHNAFSPDDIAWSIQAHKATGNRYNLARQVARVPRVFALAEFYASAESTKDRWEPAGLVDVTNNWLAHGGDVNMRSCHGNRLADLLVKSISPRTSALIKNAGADFNYRTPYILNDGTLVYVGRDDKWGNQFTINFDKYGVYYFGHSHPSFQATHVNRCVSDADVEGIGLTYVEYLLAFMNTRIGGFYTKTLTEMLTSIIGQVDLPPDIVHAVLSRGNFPRHGLPVLDILLANGADINARSKDGATLIERLFKAGVNTDLLKELQRRGAGL